MKLKLSLVFLFVYFTLNAQLSEKQLDNLINETISTFDVPGISVGIVKDGKVVYAKGHGVRSLENKKPMNSETLVGIASNSKGFTCVALAMLVDEGKLNWDDKVRQHISEFQMSDAYVTQEFTVRDLVTHRSGLALGAGDLMFFPENDFVSVQKIIDNLKFQKPESSFRSAFQYNNHMFIVAGEVVKRVSGMEWAEFIEKRILIPVGMTSSKASYNRVTNKNNIIDAHAPVDGRATKIPHDWSEVANAAGGIMSNVTDMLTWAEFLMNKGKTKTGEQLISENKLNELWNLQTPIPVNPGGSYNTHFYGYGMGWFLSDVKGQFQVQHTGGLIGTVTQFTLLPDMNLGIVVLTNQQSGAAFNAITNSIKDSYLGYEDREWVKKYDERMTNYFQNVNQGKKAVFDQVEIMKKNDCNLKVNQIIGTYSDDWMGEVTIEKMNNSLRFNFKNSETLTGELVPYNSTTYVAVWDNRSYDADAFVIFTLDEKGQATGFTMKPISDITDFSFDFVDLDFKRKE